MPQPENHGTSPQHTDHGAHDHHDHAHERVLAPRRASLLALSSGQRLLLTLPALVILWALALWAMGSP
jgi:hypothetical protein